MAGVASSSSSSSEDLTQLEATQSTDADKAYNQLLQKRKCELMYELKRIEHGERPVTGSESRDKVDNFFSQRLQRSESNSQVANVDDVETHRPEQVVIEVEGLLQRRSVSSVLQSAHFRRSLERIVRSHVQAPQRTRANSSVPTLPSRSVQATIPEVNSSEESLASNISATNNDRLSPEQLNNTPSPQDRQNDNTPPPPPPLPQNRQNGAEVPSLEEAVRTINHDYLVMEISELVHRQLVSSTLESNFRDSLERHISNRVREVGSDGIAVQRQILSLPPSNIRRNDFSHLGLLPPGQVDIDDAVSVISATASATIPYAQSNAAVNRELSAMKAQIAQLSNMLKMSLDLQMDIQRSIRQEVAAAVHQASSNTPNSTTLPSRRAADSKCIICIDGDADAVLYRCGHLCMCYPCALRMNGNAGTCPVCRAPITDIVRAYRISNE